MSTPDDTFKAQVVDARKRQILDAAGATFARKGYHRATIRDVAHEAGVADGTIYNYFENKQDLIRGLFERLQQAEGRTSAYAVGAGGTLQSFLATYLRRRTAFLMANGELFRALLPELLVDPVLRELYYQQLVLPSIEMFESFLGARMATGELRQIDEGLAARTITAGMFGLLIMQTLGDEALLNRWGELPEVMTQMLYYGLGA